MNNKEIFSNNINLQTMVLPSMQHQNISQVGLTVIAEYLAKRQDGMKHDSHIRGGRMERLMGS